MKLVDADYLSLIINGLRKKYNPMPVPDGHDEKWKAYWDREFEIFNYVLDQLREASCPDYKVIYADYGDWTPCDKELPPAGVDVILTFTDTFHKHESWPKISVKPAWICNVGEENSPDGEWAIEGRLGKFCISLEDGIAWMPLPKPYQPHESDKPKEAET